MNTAKLVLSFTMAALLGLTVGACKQSEMRAERICKRHCSALEDCKDVNYDSCVNGCMETYDECDSDADVEMALDKLHECRNEQCNEILACEANAWVECKL
jgi:hypothetical protein